MKEQPPDSKNTTTFMTYLAVICFLFTGLYIYLVANSLQVPDFVPVTISFTLGPLVYTLTPKGIG